jgi:hypothetical protein
MELEIEIDDNGAEEHFVAMADRAMVYFVPLRKAAARVRKASRENFSTQGGSHGGWAPLDPEYAAWKTLNFPGAPMLVRTGALADSIDGVRGAPIDLTSDSLSVKLPEVFNKSGDNIAQFHQYGTWKMPSREIVVSPPGFAAATGRDVADYLMGADEVTY